MKKLLIFYLVLGSFSLAAQKKAPEKVLSPKIICTVELGGTADFGTRSVEFAAVVSDSRCPKNVTCVWAGEAKVRVNLFKKDTLTESRDITLAVNDEVVTLFSAENNSVGVYSLDPYPNAKTPKANKQYVLNLIVTKKKSQEKDSTD